jgi:WD40 repeat protein
MSAIFISHSSADNAAAAEMKAWLEAQGHNSIFLDFDPAAGIPAGRDWEGELYRRLRLCRAVLVLCSPESMASRWCFAEITHARSLGKQIFPLKVAECTVDSVLSDRQVIDLTQNPEDGYERLRMGLVRAGLDAADLFDWDGKRSPYPGLVALQEEDAGVFFGRDEEIGAGVDLLHQVRRQRDAGLIMLLGASGSGKSSLLRAGLLPRLRRDVETWRVVGPFRPGENPLRELAAALGRAEGSRDVPADWRKILQQLETGGAAALTRWVQDLRFRSTSGDVRVLMVVDQFEELLGQGSDHPGASFLELLRESLRSLDGGLVVLGTMRSDFLATFQKAPALRELAFRAMTVGPLSSTGMAEVIEKPAALAEVNLEPGLVQAVLADTATEDALPLMAFALRKLYEDFAQGGKLEVRQYREALGGLQGAIARAAEGVLTEVPAEQMADLRSALLSMVRVDEEGHFARKPVAREQLPESVLPLLERFVEARLLVARQDGSLEVAHESLFRAWRKLAGWIEENREALYLRNELRLAARQWRESDEDPEYLWGGGRLSRALELRQTGRLILDAGELGFLEASEAQGERVERRRRRLRRGFLAAALLVAVVSATLALLAHHERQEANRERMRSLATLASIGQNPLDVDLLLATAALEEAPVAARSGLFTLLNDSAYLESFLHGHRELVWSLAYSPGGEQIASGGEDGIRLWDRTGVPIHALPDVGGVVSRVAFRPDGRLLAVLMGEGRLLLWDPRTGQRVERCLLPVLAEGGSGAGEGCRDGDVFMGAFGPRGRLVAVGSYSGAVRVFALADQPGETHRLRPVLECAEGCEGRHDQLVVDLAFHPEGTRLATAGRDGTVRIWDLDRGTLVGAPLTGHRQGARSVAYSPGGEELAVGSGDGVVRLWRPESGRLLAESAPHPSFVRGLAFSQDGRTLASGSADGTLRLWRLKRDREDGDRHGVLSEPELEFSELPGGVWSLAFDAGGQRLVGGSRNGAVRLWNLTVEPTVFRLHDQSWDLASAAIDPQGRWAATGDVGGTARLWDLGQPHPSVLSTLTLPCHEDGARAVAFDGAGQRLAVGGRRFVVVWDLAAVEVDPPVDCGALERGEPVAGLLARAEVGQWIEDLDFNSGDDTLAVVSQGQLRLLRLPAAVAAEGSGAAIEVAIQSEERAVRSAAYHPRGAMVAVGYNDGTLALLETGTLQPVALPSGASALRMESGVTELAFDPEGRYLAAAARDVTVQLWDTATWRPVWPRPQTSQGQVRAFAFLEVEDRLLLAADGDDWMVQVWDVMRGEEAFRLAGHVGITFGLGFDERGRLLSASEDRTIRRWPLFLDAGLRREVCRRANRNLSADEWTQWIGGSCREPCAGLAPAGCGP